jgi:hypothetical protein
VTVLDVLGAVGLRGSKAKMADRGRRLRVNAGGSGSTRNPTALEWIRTKKVGRERIKQRRCDRQADPIRGARGGADPVMTMKIQQHGLGNTVVGRIRSEELKAEKIWQHGEVAEPTTRIGGEVGSKKRRA